jgi:hypothetical protein
MWTIYLKEILELLRDRKTLIFTLVIPVLVMPLFGGSFGYASYRMSRNAMEATLPYAVFGEATRRRWPRASPRRRATSASRWRTRTRSARRSRTARSSSRW